MAQFVVSLHVQFQKISLNVFVPIQQKTLNIIYIAVYEGQSDAILDNYQFFSYITWHIIDSLVSYMGIMLSKQTEFVSILSSHSFNQLIGSAIQVSSMFCRQFIYLPAYCACGSSKLFETMHSGKPVQFIQTCRLENYNGMIKLSVNGGHRAALKSGRIISLRGYNKSH